MVWEIYIFFFLKHRADALQGDKISSDSNFDIPEFS